MSYSQQKVEHYCILFTICTPLWSHAVSCMDCSSVVYCHCMIVSACLVDPDVILVLHKICCSQSTSREIQLLHFYVREELNSPKHLSNN